MDALAIGRALAREAGLAEATTAAQLAGGRNNRVFALELADGGRVVLKIYFRHPGDTRDRLSAEWNFLQHASAFAPGRTAFPLARDSEAGAALYSFVEGRPFEAKDVDETAVRAAAEFVRLVATPGRADALAPASEACFSIAEHLATVERRVARLAGLDAAGPLGGEAREVVDGALTPTWRVVRKKAETDCAASRLDPAAAVTSTDIIASPSDFGFHNAILTTDGPVFIDFEYAGSDDPAKLVCDFFCQPQLPVGADLHEVFIAGALDPLGLSAHRTRARILLNAYRVKWIAIMLNEFMPIDEARRVFSRADDQAARRARQLDAVRARLAEIHANLDTQPI
jgi:hypothetical protein